MKNLINILLLFVLLFSNSYALARQINGFNLDNTTIPGDEIFSGGPSRDGIPSIDEPKFIAANQATYLKPKDRVLGVFINGEARAYPIRILNWHEIVNDKIKGKGIVVTFCPLCGSGVVYAADIAGKTYQFGVSGLLYNSDVLLYDRQTESLWSQILSKGISGKMVNKDLQILPSSHTSWQSWRQKYPKTKVLSKDTGFDRNYDQTPYGSYTKNERIYFPLSFKSKRYHPKERVLGITINGKHKVYPFSELSKELSKGLSKGLGSGKTVGKINDTFAGKNLVIEVDSANRDGTIMEASGEILPSINTFWFSWYAFHPDSLIFKPKE